MKEFLGGNGLIPIYFDGRWLRPYYAGACSGGEGRKQSAEEPLPAARCMGTGRAEGNG